MGVLPCVVSIFKILYVIIVRAAFPDGASPRDALAYFIEGILTSSETLRVSGMPKIQYFCAL